MTKNLVCVALFAAMPLLFAAQSTAATCPLVVVAPAPVSLTGGAPANIAATSGAGQWTQQGTCYANNLVVTVTDSSNNPVSGVTVSFTGPGINSSSAVTDANGKASTTITANSTLGGNTVTAALSGSNTIVTSFGLTAGALASCSQSISVGSNADSNAAGTLREALFDVCPGGTVDLSGLAGQTITLANRLYLSENVTIQGPANSTVTVSGSSATRIFFVESGSINISNLTLANGLAQGGNSGYGGAGAGMGGALFQNGGSVTLSNVALTGNQATGGTAPTGTASYGGGGFGGDAPAYYGTGGSGGDLADGAGGNEPSGAGGFGGGGSIEGTFAPNTNGPGAVGPGGTGGFGGGGAAGSGGTEGGFGGGSSNGGFEGGGGAGFGGAIFERAGTLTLNTVSFTNNTATAGKGGFNGQAKGGALFVFYGATANLTDVTFSGSVAADAGNPGIGSSPAPYTNDVTCPSEDTVDICGQIVDAEHPQIYSGNAQSGVTTRTLPQPFIVSTAGSGNTITFTIVPDPISGASGTFLPINGFPVPTLSNGNTVAQVLTDSQGYATSPQLTASATAGSPTVTASDGVNTVIFSVTTSACVAAPSVSSLTDTGVSGELRYAVNNACAGSTINLSGLSGTITLGSRLRIDDNLTISGAGANALALDGGSSTRLFFIGNGNVSINNLTLQNGLGKGGNGAAGMGGAIFQNGGNLSVAGVTFSGNQGAGGAPGGNSAGGGFGGNAVSNHGADGGDLFGIGGVFSSNGGNGGPGGGGGSGGHNGGSGGFGAAGGNSFNGGSGGFGGGGAAGYNAGSGGFGGGSNVYSGGGGAGFGGAIFSYAGTLSLNNDIFTAHSVSAGGNGAQAKGGALFIYSGATANLTGVTFSGSVAADAGQPGVGSSPAPYTNGATCPGEDSVDVCGFTNNAVTINTNPAGLSFSVDGTPASTAQTVTWTSGSTHSLATTTLQSNYKFTGWSDGTTTTTESVTASRTVTSYTANFQLNTVQVTIGTNQPGTSFLVDSNTYTSSQQFNWNVGDKHTIATTSPQAGATGIQYVFTGWSDGGAMSHQITVSAATTSYTASFKTQYLLTTAASPSSFGTVSAGGYFDANSTPVVTATGNTNYQFSSWSGNVASASSASTTVAMAGPESVTANFSGSAGFVTGQTPGPLRNNYTGFVGMEFTVGSTPAMAYSLGRFVVAGNTQTHKVKLVQANGTDVPGGSVTISTAGATPGQFQYTALASPVTLLANTSYFLVSQETSGGDQWYDYGSVTTAPLATVVAPTYTDSFGHYVPVGGLPGRSYVSVSFLYAPPTTSLSVSIASPAPSATISGTASVTVSTTGPVTSLQVQVDGVNQGSAVPVSVNAGPTYTLSLDTTVIKIGSHLLTVVANGSVVSPAVSVTVSNAPGGSTAFVLGQTPGSLRNNFSGFVGMSLKVGSTPVVVASLGRFAAPGNTGTHLVKLVNSNGTDVPGGSVSISMSGSTPGTFQYASLPAGPFTLQANTTYYLVSQETAGGDYWYDYGKVSTSVAASVVGPTYTDGFGNYLTVGGLGGDSYVPLSFLYGPTANTLSANITSLQNASLLSGTVQVQVSTTGTVTSYQLQVDGTNFGAAVSSSPVSLDTTQLGNGQHTLSVVVSGNSAMAVSPGVTVTVNNVAATTTAFVTAQTARTLRNNYSGFVGMQIVVGATPLQVVSLGRYVVSGNTGTHLLKLVQANGTDVAGGSVTINTSGATAGKYMYGALPATVTLAANTTYYLVSQEVAGGDMWYDLEPITTTGIAQVAGPTYADGQGHYVTVGGFAGYSYVPVSFLYQEVTP